MDEYRRLLDDDLGDVLRDALDCHASLAQEEERAVLVVKADQRQGACDALLPAMHLGELARRQAERVVPDVVVDDRGVRPDLLVDRDALLRVEPAVGTEQPGTIRDAERRIGVDRQGVEEVVETAGLGV